MNIDTSFLTYFFSAGIVVKLILLILVSASILSWTFILQRAFFIRGITNSTSSFEKHFWTGGDLSALYQESLQHKDNLHGIEAIFSSAFKEFLRLLKQPGITAEAIRESATRAMRVAEMQEQDKLELHLPILATIGSVCPYIGLFGTVWGIMTSLRALAHVQQATIAMVAPGIAEALVATAMGLFAAIPAYIAYNRYANDINRLLNRFAAFQDEFSNILFRQAQMTITNKTQYVEA